MGVREVSQHLRIRGKFKHVVQQDKVVSMIELLARGWRGELAEIASAARRSVIIAAPFIKYDEAFWLCNLLHEGVDVLTLANLDVEAVSTAALDLAALRCLAEVSSFSRLIALSALHAKVFVVDEKAAIVTSGNLTRSGLDSNLEYGVLLEEPKLVRKVCDDMASFARLGSPVDLQTIDELAYLEIELRQARSDVIKKPTQAAIQRFDQVMRQARPAMVSAQVGDRTAHAVFGDAIHFVLAKGPQTTKTIQQEVQYLMPELCDDSEILMIKGERYGRIWKRRFRHAQLHLKRRGVVSYNPSTREWALINNEIFQNE